MNAGGGLHREQRRRWNRAEDRDSATVLDAPRGTVVADGDPEEVLHEGHIAYVFEVPARTFRNPADEWDYYIL